MADHVWNIGTGDQMMIRDLGIANGHVEFWFHSDSATWNYQQNWGYDAGGGYVGGEFRLEKNGAWHHLGTVYIPTSRNVMMRMVDEGLGWPTSDRTVWISRAGPPPAPIMYGATALGISSVRVNFGSGGDGGAPVYEWEITYGTNPNSGTQYITSNGLTDIAGLAPGTWWYFWARGRNSLGWGGWSGRAQAFTWRIPDAPSPVTFDQITQTSLRARFNGGFDGGEPVDEWQLAYGLDPNTEQFYLPSSGTNILSNLKPGATYYFWARGRNEVGWGPWSSVRAQTLRAGAMVKRDGTWRRALQYEKVNGIWRLAKPYVKHGGVWRETL